MHDNVTLQELELRLETQKQTLLARDESIKKLLEMLQNKGMGEFVDSFDNIDFYCLSVSLAVAYQNFF